MQATTLKISPFSIQPLEYSTLVHFTYVVHGEELSVQVEVVDADESDVNIEVNCEYPSEMSFHDLEEESQAEIQDEFDAIWAEHKAN